jgi:LmbE family N-acetylglucosaminyl deacetylase
VKTTVRRICNQLCRRALDARTRRDAQPRLEGTAVVFSPHYDDETLGAGGTIIRKRRLGAEVHLVFMTDGSRSHASVMDGPRLSAVRRAEALKAARELGVPDSHVRFLELPETRMAQHIPDAVDRVARLLSEVRCQQVFIPSRLEPLIWSADHNVTTEVVFQALARLGQRPEIWEYLVWFWYHWPWVPLRRGADARQVFRLTCRNLFGLSAWMGLNTAVNVAEVQPEKRRALDQYESQMTRLVPDKPWPVLSDVAQGEFLKCFFQPSEYFKRHSDASARNACPA